MVSCEDDEIKTEEETETTEETEEMDDSDSEDTSLSVNNYVLAATGQAEAFDLDGNTITSLSEGDDLWGQDAHYLKGETMSYTDNSTGLMWSQDDNGEGLDWEDALSFAEKQIRPVTKQTNLYCFMYKRNSPFADKSFGFIDSFLL